MRGNHLALDDLADARLGGGVEALVDALLLLPQPLLRLAQVLGAAVARHKVLRLHPEEVGGAGQERRLELFRVHLRVGWAGGRVNELKQVSTWEECCT